MHPVVSPWYPWSRQTNPVRSSRPRLRQHCSDILSATSTAVEPLSEKKTRESPSGAIAASRDASRTAGSWVTPANRTWSSRSICRVTASRIRGCPCPWTTHHQLEIAS